MKKKILIVEYAAATIEILKEIFAHPLFELTIVGEGEAAKRQLADHTYDMMISAAMLPKFHGFNLSQFARENYPDLKVILMSEVYKGMNYRQQAIRQYQADDFFEKPFDKAKFKGRSLELLEVLPTDLLPLKDEATTELPIIDTKKMSTLAELEKQHKMSKQMSSEDLFGDIIHEVSKAPFEIKLNGNGETGNDSKPEVFPRPVSPETMEMPALTRVMPAKTRLMDVQPGADSPVTQVIPRSVGTAGHKPDVSGAATQQIDLDIMELIKRDRKPPQKPREETTFKKIEDDISRKFEETLSGLGLTGKKSDTREPARAPSRPAQPPQPAQTVPIPPRSTAPQERPTTQVLPPRPEPVRPTIQPVKPTPPPTQPVQTQSRPAPQPEPSFKPTEVIPTVPKPPTVKPVEKAEELGGYEILGLIGRGGMAEIYKAKRRGVKGFEKVIALKKILSGYGEDAKYLEMFVDEAKIAAELTHPNIVQIYDLGKKDDYYFIAMEYIFGKDLRLILHKLAETDILMPEELSIFLIINVLKALEYAHSAKNSKGNSLDIVHRDVSPPNILVSYYGDIKLTDFGVSKASIKMHQTVAGALKGKILYMSPEQARAVENIDFRSDLYSAGIILFELVTGKKLFLGSTEIVTLQKVQEGKVIRPSQVREGISPELETIILKALEKEPQRRYAKAADMIKALEDYLALNFDNMPDAVHLSHFLYRLFEGEIRSQGLDIQLKPLPYLVMRRSLKWIEPGEAPVGERSPLKTSPESDELLELSEDMREEVSIPPVLEEEDGPAPQEKYSQPVIEISFDDEKKTEFSPAKTRPMQKTQERKPSRPEPVSSMIMSEFERQEHHSNKTRNMILIAVGIILVLAAVILFLLKGSSSDEPADTSATEQPSPTQPTTDISNTPGWGTPDTGSTTTPGLETGQPVTTGPEIVEVKPGEQTTAVTTPGMTTDPNVKKQEIKAENESTTSGNEVLEKKQKTETELEKQESGKTPPPGETIAKTEEKQTEIKVEKTATETGAQAQPKGEDNKTVEPAVTTPIEKQPEPVEVQDKPVTEPPVSQVKPEEIKEGDVLSPSEVDVAPTPVSTPDIEVTHRERRLMMSDQQVLVSFLVDHNGNVETVKILKKSSLKKLNTLIEDTIKKWKFKPALKNNIRVKVWKNKWILIKK